MYPLPTLICIPHAGGGASAYSRWAQELAPAAAVRVVQLPGREIRRRETLASNLRAAVADLYEQVKPHTDRPFALFGHSMGGLMAFELAHALHQTLDRSPLRLFVSACSAPDLTQIEPPFTHLADGSFTDELCRRYGGIPAAILDDADYMAAILPALRADFGILESYAWKARPPLDCPITAFGSENDPVIPLDAVRAWIGQTAAGFDMNVLQGGHFYLQSNRRALAERIRAVLDAGQPGDTVPARLCS